MAEVVRDMDGVKRTTHFFNEKNACYEIEKPMEIIKIGLTFFVILAGDLRVTSALLYRLSYTGVFRVCTLSPLGRTGKPL